MYPPKQHQENNFKNIVNTINTFPLATLITVDEQHPIVSHIPLMYKTNKVGLGTLIGHMDINNPQQEHLENNTVSVIFHGPDAYISPTAYTTKQLPTWNYIKVHIKGKVTKMKNTTQVMDSLIEMNDFLETSGTPFVLEKNHEKMNRFINYIVGFEILIQEWEGKFKLSQDKLLKDQTAAKEVLKMQTAPVNYSYIEQVYKNHEQKK